MPEEKQNLKIIEKKPSDEEISQFPSYITLNAKQEKELTKVVYDEIDEAITAMGSLTQEKKGWMDLYEGNIEEKDFPWIDCANVAAATAVVSSISEGYHDRIMPSLFGGHYVWIARGRPGSDQNEAEEAQEHLHYIQGTQMQLEESFDDAVYDFTKTGNMTGVLEWQYQTQAVRDMEHYDTLEDMIEKNKVDIGEKVKDGYFEVQDVDGNSLGFQIQEEYKPYMAKLERGEPQDIPVQYQKPVKNHPVLEFIDWDDFFVSGGRNAHKDLSRARVVGHKLSLRWDDLKRRARKDENGKATNNDFGIYFNLKKLKAAYSVEKSKRDEKIDEEYKKRTYDIRQCLFRCDIDKDGLEELCIFSIEWDKKILIRADYFPYWHSRPNYIDFRLIPSGVNKRIAWGIPKLLENLADEYDKMTNQQLDNNTIANTVQFEGIRGSSAEEEFAQKGYYPGVDYWFDTFNEVRQMKIQHNAIDTLPYKQELKSLMEVRAGYSQYFGGQTPADDPEAPASKTAMLMQEALKKVEDVIKRMRRGPMKELAYQLWELEYQFSGKDKKIGARGRTGALEERTVSRRKMDRFGMSWIPIGTSAKTNRELDKMLLLQLIETIKANPEIFGMTLQDPQAIRELAESTYRAWGDEIASKLDKLLPTEEELHEKQIQIQMEAIRRVKEEEEYVEKRKGEGAEDEEIEKEIEDFRNAQSQIGTGQQTQGGQV